MSYTVDDSYWDSVSYSNSNKKNFDEEAWNTKDKTITGTSGNDKYTGFDELEFIESSFIDFNQYYDNPNLTLNMGAGDDFLKFEIWFANSSDWQNYHHMDLVVNLGRGNDYFNFFSEAKHSSSNYVDYDAVVYGGEGDDFISFDSAGGSSTLIGGEGNDFVAGGSTDDIIYGDYDDDTAESSSKSYNDILMGGDGSDEIFGGYGDDILVGGDINSDGVDLLTGGSGHDTFVVSDWATGSSSAWDGWALTRGIYATGDTIQKLSGLSNPAAKFFLEQAISIAKSAFSTWLTAADDSTYELDPSDGSYAEILDFNLRDDMVVLPTFTGYNFDIDEDLSGGIVFNYDGDTGKFLEIHIEGEVDDANNFASGFYQDFLDGAGLSYATDTEKTLYSSFAKIMVNSIALIEKDSSGNITITQNGSTETYTDSELDKYYSDDWSSIIGDETSIMLLGADTGYSSSFNASGKYVAGGDGNDSFWGVDAMAEYAYVVSFDGDDYYNHKSNLVGFTFNGGEGKDTVSFAFSAFEAEYVGSTEGVTIDLSVEEQIDFNYGGTVTSTDSNGEETITYIRPDAILIDVENVVGTDFDDHLTGNDDNNVLMGIGGSNYLDGGSGYDTAAYYGDVLDYTYSNGVVSGSYVTIDYLDLDEDNDKLDDFTYSISDTLTNIEFLMFDDGFIYLSEDGSLSEFKVYGDDEGNVVSGSHGSDWLYGFDGGDTLKGYGGDDHFVGGRGSDTIRGYAGVNAIDGTGSDTAHYYDGVAEYLVEYLSDTDMETTVQDLDTSAFNEGKDTLENIEYIQFGDGAVIDLVNQEIYTGDNSDNDIYGSDSSDDWLFGGDGDDTIRGRQGDDHLVGGEGDDWLYGRSISNTSNTGIDTAYYAGSIAEFELSFDFSGGSYYSAQIDDQITQDYDEGTDSLYNIEFLHFGDGVVIEIANYDAIEVSTTGYSTNDFLFDAMGSNVNRLEGKGGDDGLVGMDGNDNIDGGSGSDTAYYAGSVAEFLVTYVSDTDIETTVEDLNSDIYDEGKDTLTKVETLHFGDGVTIDIENVTIYTGTDSDETLVGTTSGSDTTDWLFGGAGNDTLKGGDGDDHLVGGEGDDIIYGHSISSGINTNHIDTAYYADVIDNYDIDVWTDDSGYTWMSVEDIGDDAYDEGKDELCDIDYVSFNGTEYSVLELAAMAA